jgi:hypothetical protein
MGTFNELNKIPRDVRRLIGKVYLRKFDRVMMRIALGYDERADMTIDLTNFCVENGYLDLLKYSISLGKCNWDIGTIIRSTKTRGSNDLDILSYLVSLRDLSHGEKVVVTGNIAQYGTLSMFGWMLGSCLKTSIYFGNIYENAAFNPNGLEMISLLYEQDNHLGDGMCKVAAFVGNLGLLQWLYDKEHLDTYHEMLENALTEGHLHIIKWLVTIDDYEQIDPEPAFYSTNINLDLLKWLYAYGSVFNEECFQYAAQGSCQIEILNWLYSIDCPFDANELFCTAACNATPNVMEWLYNKSPRFHTFNPINVWDCAISGENNGNSACSIENIQWLLKNNIPKNETIDQQLAHISEHYGILF